MRDEDIERAYNLAGLAAEQWHGQYAEFRQLPSAQQSLMQAFATAVLDAAQEEQGLEAKVREVLGERFITLQPLAWITGWSATWAEHGLRKRADGATLPALLRAILEVEAKGG